jgi:orotate phosphoribosyltransferase
MKAHNDLARTAEALAGMQGELVEFIVAFDRWHAEASTTSQREEAELRLRMIVARNKLQRAIEAWQDAEPRAAFQDERPRRSMSNS